MNKLVSILSTATASQLKTFYLLMRLSNRLNYIIKIICDLSKLVLL